MTSWCNLYCLLIHFRHRHFEYTLRYNYNGQFLKISHRKPHMVAIFQIKIIIKKRSNGNLSGTSTEWLLVHRNPDRIGIWRCWFLRGGENRSTQRKTSRAEKRTNNKLNPHMASSPRIGPVPHWWEASALTTTPSLLPMFKRNYLTFMRMTSHHIVLDV